MKAGEEPERATFPFVMANAAQAMDVEAAVILQGNGVYLAKKGYVDDITFCRDDQRQIYGGLLKLLQPGTRLIPNCVHTGNLCSVGADPCVRPQVGRTRGCAPTDRELFLLL